MIIVFDLTTGQILKTVSAPDGHANLYGSEGEGVILTGTWVSDATHYVENGVLTEYLESPSPHHEWDWPTKTWIPNLDAARASKLQQVAVELNTRLYLPCNGFDADRVSRERISCMIARLQRGDGLPAGWIGWRDASNQQRWAEDDNMTVLANLTTLSRAIEDREQTLLAAGWQHKANIAALTDIDAILSYDATTGWPT